MTRYWTANGGRWAIELRTLRTGQVYEVTDLYSTKCQRVSTLAAARAVVDAAERRRTPIEAVATN